MPPTLKEVKEKLDEFNVYSVRDGVFTIRRGFFYTMGRTSEDLVGRVKNVFPNAIIMDSGEVWKPFRGGASVANQSHWYVKFRFPKPDEIEWPVEMTDEQLSGIRSDGTSTMTDSDE